MKRVLLFIGMSLSVLSVFAEDNVLQTIEVEPVKDTYNIVLIADKAVNIKKEVIDSNKITLSMKDIRASKTLNTVYNNVSNVDTVMVEPQGNGIRIFFQGENAAESTVTFDSLAPALPAQNETKTLKLNNPIESYAPIYKEDYQTEKTSALFKKLKASQAVESLSETVDESDAGDTANKIFSFGIVALLGYFVLRLFKRKEPEMQIGLSQSLNEREINMYKGLQPLAQPPASLEKPFTTVNYGLNAYKKETRDPYETQPQEMQFHNSKLRNYVNPQSVQDYTARTVTRPVSPLSQAVAQTQLKKHTTPVNTAPVNQSNPNIDNLKFLESMTAIYEKSGRYDLARGLKASLSKNNIQ